VPGQQGFKRVCEQSANVLSAQPGTKAVYYDDKLALGDLLHWQEILYGNTVPVKIQKRDRATGRYSIDGFPEVSKSAAMEYLMIGHHLSEGTAEHLLDRTDREHFVEALRTKVAFSGSPSRDSISVNFPHKDKTTDWLTGMDIEQDLETTERVDALMNERPRHSLDFYLVQLMSSNSKNHRCRTQGILTLRHERRSPDSGNLSVRKC
jgi:hypothetical protein